MDKTEKVWVSVSNIWPQEDGSAECRVFFRIHLALPSLAGPYVEVFPRIENARDATLLDTETRAIASAFAIMTRITSEDVEGLTQLWTQGMQENASKIPVIMKVQIRATTYLTQ
jgi:hypothetical protein